MVSSDAVLGYFDIDFVAGTIEKKKSDFINQNRSKRFLMVGSLAGITVCAFLAQLSTEMYAMEC